MTDKRCETCAFWDRRSVSPRNHGRNHGVDGEYSGLCRKTPPTPLSSMRPWAETYADDWCGYYFPRPDEAEPPQ
jgi:hypothetical protein